MPHIPGPDEYPPRNRFRHCPLCATELARAEVFERERQRCPSCGWVWFPNPNVAATMVIEHAGGIVLLRRAIPPDVGIWHLPIGHAEYGEHPADAALREAQEETGLALADPLFLSWEHSPSYQDPALFYVVFGFTARVVGGALRHDPHEASELAVVPLDQLPPLKWTSQQKALEAFRALRVKG